MSRITLAHTTLVRASLTLALASSTLAHATNGYLPHGYGTQSKGSAGAGVAMAQDTLAAATNPAGLIDLGNRLDVGIEIFSPDRSSSIVGNAFGPDQTFDGNSTRVFYIPEFGYSRVVSPNLSIGLSIYGNGGMNTDYSSNPYARFGATGPAGIDLAQVFVTPALAWRFAEGQSLGVAVNLAYQQFEARTRWWPTVTATRCSTATKCTTCTPAPSTPTPTATARTTTSTPTPASSPRRRPAPPLRRRPPSH